MKFGKQLASIRDRRSQRAHAQAFFDYKGIKKRLRHDVPASSDFTYMMRRQQIKCYDHVLSVFERLSKEFDTVVRGKAQLHSMVQYNVLERLAGEIGCLLCFIDGNQVGMRKMAKKYDKKSQAAQATGVAGLRISGQQDACLRWLETAPMTTTVPQQLRSMHERLVELCHPSKRTLLQQHFDALADVQARDTDEADMVFRVAQRRQEQRAKRRNSSPISPMRSLEPSCSSPLRHSV